MAEFKTIMDVFKLLEKSNCRKCGEKTCLVFAAAVFGGTRSLAECPQVPASVAGAYSMQPRKQSTMEEDREKQLAELKSRVMQLDLVEAASRIGASHNGSRLVLTVMGKRLEIDASGRVFTGIHTNPWVMAPIYNYILACKGTPIQGRWVPLRELPSGKDWYRLFGQTCETPMKKVADTYTDLFSDLMEIFNGQKAEDQFQSDVALILYPLPLVPLLICYWRPEQGMESAFNLFFDASAEDNLGIDGIYSLGTGITRMFEKLALTHGMVSSR